MIAHLAAPGPAYWSWRCLRCGELVDGHPSWWRLLFRRSSPDSGKGDL